LRWAIVYTDRSVFTSDDGPPESAPRRGVQVVLVADQAHNYRHEFSNPGRWGWRDDHGTWFGYDDHEAAWDYLVNYEGRPLLIYGERMNTEDYYALRRWADEQFGAKSGWWHGEQRGP
jgi:hypothetical protein